MKSSFYLLIPIQQQQVFSSSSCHGGMRLKQKLFNHATFFSNENPTCTLTFFVTKSEDQSRTVKGHCVIWSVVLFLKALQEDLVKRLPRTKGSLPLGMLFSFLALTPGRKRKYSWHLYSTQSFQSTFTHNKKKAKRNSLQKNLMPY